LIGCDCDPKLPSHQRCTQKVMRCNGSFAAYAADMRRRGLDNFGLPLSLTKVEWKKAMEDRAAKDRARKEAREKTRSRCYCR